MKRGRFLVFFLIIALSTICVVNADVLKFGSRGTEVKELQLNLELLGYFNGNANGIFGNATRDAVKKYQASNGFIAAGEIDKALFERIALVTAGYTVTKSDIIYCQRILKELGYYKGKVDGIAGPMTEGAITSFQESEKLKPTGKLNKHVYMLLSEKDTKSSGIQITSRGGGVDRKEVMASASQTAEVELLDWWSEANTVFYIDAEAVVVDLWTDKSFKMVRTYGTNHADCEALTKEDSEIIKDIWGGDWSWSRRPVIIEIDGRRLAASMAAMPHAGLDNKEAGAYVYGRSGGYGYGYNLDKIKDNGMDGHVDIHFLNSRTHGTNTVNEAHQKAVLEAAGQ
ncbi:MAG: peptidoglycan-binding domain-containing protein [Bacillota bacterium]